jgi:DNA-binding protein YbaB
MNLEILDIKYRFLNDSKFLKVTVGGSKDVKDIYFDEVTVTVIIDRPTQEDLLALSFGEIRNEALERAKSLISAIA